MSQVRMSSDASGDNVSRARERRREDLVIELLLARAQSNHLLREVPILCVLSFVLQKPIIKRENSTPCVCVVHTHTNAHTHTYAYFFFLSLFLTGPACAAYTYTHTYTNTCIRPACALQSSNCLQRGTRTRTHTQAHTRAHTH